MAQVFISYSSKNETTALKIVDQIEKAGFSCWIACRDIPIGRSFAREIPPEISKCSAFVLLLSSASMESEDVLNELTLAKDKSEKKKAIIPLLLENIDPFGKTDFKYHLINTQIRKYYLNPENTMNEVIEQLRELFPMSNPPKPVAALANKVPPKKKSKRFFDVLKDLFAEPESQKSTVTAAAAQPAKPKQTVSQDNGPKTLTPEMMEYFQPFIDELEQKIYSSGSTADKPAGSEKESPRNERTTPPIRQPPQTKQDPVVKSSLYDTYVVNKQNQDTNPPAKDARENRSGGSGASLYDRYGSRENPQKQSSASSGASAEDDYKNAMEWYSINRYTEAVVWFRKAANQNHAESQYRLAYCYHQGQGVQKDMTMATYWYRKAAENGHVLSMEWMGMFYHYGTAFPQDLDEARKWYQKAIDRGSVYASQQLKLLQKKKV